MSATRVFVIIPALNGEQSLGRALRDIPTELNVRVIVADNGSAERTPEIAAAAGACVVYEQRRGYGAACRRGMTQVARHAAADENVAPRRGPAFGLVSRIGRYQFRHAGAKSLPAVWFLIAWRADPRSAAERLAPDRRGGARHEPWQNPCVRRLLSRQASPVFRGS